MSDNDTKKTSLGYFRKIIAKTESFISILCLMFMCVFVFAGVVMRFLLKIPFSWGEEISRYLMVTTVMIGISMGVKEKAHLGVTILIDKMPKIINRIMSVIEALAGITLFVVLTYFSYKFAATTYKYGQESPAMRLPMFVMYIVVTVGFGLSAIDYIFNTIEKFFIKKPELSDTGARL